MQHHPLLAMQAIAAVDGLDPRGDLEGVVARSLFAQRAGELDVAGGDPFEQRIVPATLAQEFNAEQRRHIRFDHQPTAEFLHHAEYGEGVAAETAVFLGHRQRRQAEFDHRGPGVWRDAQLGMDDRAPRLEAVVAADPAPDRIGQLLLFPVQFEMHAVLTVPGSSGR